MNAPDSEHWQTARGDDLVLDQIAFSPDGKLFGLDADGRVWIKQDIWRPITMRKGDWDRKYEDPTR